jgi:hypothetical protein
VRRRRATRCCRRRPPARCRCRWASRRPRPAGTCFCSSGGPCHHLLSYPPTHRPNIDHAATHPPTHAPRAAALSRGTGGPCAPHTQRPRAERAPRAPASGRRRRASSACSTSGRAWSASAAWLGRRPSTPSRSSRSTRPTPRPRHRNMLCCALYLHTEQTPGACTYLYLPWLLRCFGLTRSVLSTADRGV